MQYSLFISDLHLCETRPEITQSFISFLNTVAKPADALYILGDLFEYWPGDDSILAGFHANVIQALNAFAQKTKTYFMHGNRDFLISEGFAAATNIHILHDPSLVSSYGKRVLLSHGDHLCTDDIDYQKFRDTVRTASWQHSFLEQTLEQRLAYIAQIRSKSELEKSIKSVEIMDVNQQAVDNMLKEFAYPSIFIHGHTHRPMRHLHQLSNHICERWVLGDWYEQGSYLKLDANGCSAYSL